jgi:hydroxyethylthiazole kinase-like uncharacterized protein yjeF
MAELFTFDDVLARWPRLGVTGDKYARGVVGIATGSNRYPGAGMLSVLGAVNSGAGFVRYLGPEVVRQALMVRVPSVTLGPGNVDAWVVGSGWDDEESNDLPWQRAMASGVGVIVDAGGLRHIDGICPVPCLLTPHRGELARLLGVDRAAVEASPEDSALEAAQRHGCVVLLKGHHQLVAHHDGTLTRLPSGSPGLARAGSGDVLAGIAGTLLAQTGDPQESALLAAGFQAWVSTLFPAPYPPDRMAEFMAEYVPGYSPVVGS